ncbi:MAG: dienelactone hydrolase family protein [Candidatus Nitrosocaldus sp.]|nr:dienelactone hydrolase family protein [Candidatus Nitrosocaldus sp.]MDW8000559.1 dienelactone hydrolase family protein [Candidatus Nitrosocaldus sp.]
MEVRSVRIDISTVEEGKGRYIEGDLVVSSHKECMVVFAHGSGSSRFSPRNRFVAGVLNGAGLSTLMLDLLTREEDAADSTGRYRFDIELLASRLVDAVTWLERLIGQDLRIGYFGASTGAAAALIAYARYPRYVRAIVSRGGRVDLATPYLSKISAPTLLLVGGYDTPVLRLNREAMGRFKGDCTVRLEVIPNATHLFEEPGALEQVADKAREWFIRYLL